ncbi:molybdenum cofactor biosynthesis protein MoaE [Janibacter alkaliphilus]|uniref:molybdenum cofactor biosynthesis protein MoaE n=1 Tax=Janibacter alkaliphilus TaxID=1069963 RepID=UPI0015CBD75C|nr:molybdenum cofactor biosynthesis protein MoaE [Janibacter alkaliphilus]
MPLAHAAVTDAPLDLGRLSAVVGSTQHGAVATFVGVVRDHDPEADGEVVALDYSAHPEAPQILERVVRDVLARYDHDDAATVAAAHRTGHLAVGDLALVVCVGSAHRALAFDVCREVVEEIKRELPVWKKQHQADGAHVWSGLTC